MNRRHVAFILLLLLPLGCACAENADLERLRNLRAKQVQKIDKVYLKELESLKSKFLKAENLGAANEVQEEIDLINAKYGGEVAESKTLTVTYWNWANGGQLWMRSDGVCRHSAWKGKGVWTRKDKDVVIISYRDTKYQLTFKTPKFAEMHNLTYDTHSSIQFVREQEVPAPKAE